MTAGDRIRNERKARGLSQAEFASLLGVSQSALSDAERDGGGLKASFLLAFSDFTGKSIDWILKGNQIVSNARFLTPEETVSLPLYLAPASAGLPTPVSPQVSEETVLVTKEMVPHPKDSYAVKVAGDSMKGAGIQWGDIVIVDRKKEVTVGSIVVAVVEGGTTVKRLQNIGDRWFLYAANDDYKPIEITDLETTLQGVVIALIRDLKNLN